MKLRLAVVWSVGIVYIKINLPEKFSSVFFRFKIMSTAEEIYQNFQGSSYFSLVQIYKCNDIRSLYWQSQEYQFFLSWQIFIALSLPGQYFWENIIYFIVDKHPSHLNVLIRVVHIKLRILYVSCRASSKLASC